MRRRRNLPRARSRPEEHDASSVASELREKAELLTDSELLVRTTAARSLAQFDPGPRASGATEMHSLTTDALVKMLNRDRDPRARIAAAGTLASYTDEVALDAVFRVLQRRRKTDLAVGIAERLLDMGCSGDPEKWAVGIVLRGNPTAPDLASMSSGELLIALLEEGSQHLQVVAATRLGERHCSEAVSALTDALHSPSDSLREAAAGALSALGGPEDSASLDGLVEMLLASAISFDDAQELEPETPLEVRDADARALRGWPRGPTDLVLTPGYGGAEATAVASFGLRGAERLLDDVGRRADLSTYALAKAAACLVKIGSAAEPALRAALTSSDPNAELVAAAVFTDRWAVDASDLGVVPLLISTSSSPDPRVRATAVTAIGKTIPISDAPSSLTREVVDTLLERIDDDAPGVRRVALAQLAAIATYTPVDLAPQINRLLHERPPSGVQLAAALASSAPVRAVLSDVIQGGPPEARAYALVAVQKAAKELLFNDALLADERLREQVARASDDAASTTRDVARATVKALSDAEQERARVEETRREYEAQEASGLRFDRVQAATAYGILGGIGGPPEVADRCPDVCVFTGDRKRNAIPEFEPLSAATWYWIEVAVRRIPQGLGAHGGFRPIPELAEEGDAVTLLVSADSDDFDIEDTVRSLVLPHGGDSEQNAWFRIRPRRSASAEDLARLEIRIYYEYNLVDAILFESEVGPRLNRTPTSLRSDPAMALRQGVREHPYDDVAGLVPREMHVTVDREGDRYALAFAFPNHGEPTVLRATTPVGVDELDDLLVTIRDLWRSIALDSAFVDEISPAPPDAQEQLVRLATEGRRIWTALFRREQDQGLARVGDLLARHPLPDDATIQVSVAKAASTFAFPWGLLYDRPRPQPGEPIDINGFWGMRYRIEQGVPGCLRAPDIRPSVAAPEALELAYMLWNRFRNSAEHSAMLADLGSEAGGNLNITAPPVADADACLAVLSAGASDVLYFYTHGFTRRRGAPLAVEEEVARLKRWLENLPADHRGPMVQSLYDSVSGGAPIDRSYISFPFSRVFLDDLYDDVNRFAKAPFVFLNMCESAQLSPSLSDSFVHFFLDRGAHAVIGTECPMTVSFAHPFASRLLSNLFRGAPVGSAIVDARRHFMREHANPLGLAYTLYGNGTGSFQPPPIIAPVQPSTT